MASLLDLAFLPELCAVHDVIIAGVFVRIISTLVRHVYGDIVMNPSTTSDVRMETLVSRKGVSPVVFDAILALDVTDGNHRVDVIPAAMADYNEHGITDN